MRFKHIVIYGTLLIMACNNHTKDHKKGSADRDTALQGADTSKPANIDTNKVIKGTKEERADTIFTGFGTEPFWSVYVIDNRKIVFHPADGPDVEVPYVNPVNPDISHSYYFSSEGKVSIDLRIQKKNCSDGMSEEVHPYSVILTVNKIKYTGCGNKKE